MNTKKKATLAFSPLLKKPGTLGHLVEVLIIQESVDQFLISILEKNPSKSEIIAKMNATFREESEYVPILTEDKLEEQLPR